MQLEMFNIVYSTDLGQAAYNKLALTSLTFLVSNVVPGLYIVICVFTYMIQLNGNLIPAHV